MSAARTEWRSRETRSASASPQDGALTSACCGTATVRRWRRQPWKKCCVSDENATNSIQMFGRSTAVPADYGRTPPAKVRHTIGLEQ